MRTSQDFGATIEIAHSTVHKPQRPQSVTVFSQALWNPRTLRTREPGLKGAPLSVFTNSSASHSADQAREYTAAVLALLGDRDPLDVLRSTPDAARHIVAGLSESELSRPEAERKWSLRQVIRHLADSELVWAYRLRMVLAQDRPPITGYDQDLWANRLHYQEASLDESLEEFAVVRRSNLRLLAAATDAELS